MKMIIMKTNFFRTFLLAAALLALPAAVQAQFTYTTNNGTITITGHTGNGGAVIIPAAINGLPVTSIGNNVFANTSVTRVTISDSVTNIGVYVFLGCPNLTNITVSSLNPAYSSLDGVLFDKSQTTLIQYPGAKAGNYTIPGGVISIGDEAFYLCSSLTNVMISASVIIIGEEAFYGCPSLTGISISNSVTSIGRGAFQSCGSLTNVNIGNGVTSIGNGAFNLCGGLMAITMDAANPAYSSLGGVLFDKSQVTLIQFPEAQAGNYTIPGSVTSILDGAFEECVSLTSVTIPGSATSVGDNAFAGTTSLTNVMIGSGVTSIGGGAFSATSLTSVTIPDSVTNIGVYAFSGCYSLINITVSSLNLAYCSLDGVLFDKSQVTLIQCPGAKAGNYTIPGGVTSIPDEAFEECVSLTSVTIPASVTNIGVGVMDTFAFTGCWSLTNITVSSLNLAYSSVDGALFDKSQVTLIQCPNAKAGNCTIPASVKGIYYEAFYSCTHLTGIYFRGNAPVIAPDALVGSPFTVHYLPGTGGWGSTFAGCPTALWLPQIQTGDSSFGVRTNQFGFNINWASGQTVVVEACTNLTNPTWAAIGTNTLTGDSFHFSDSQWTNYPARFYRLRSP
jgi:hypothetical protein